MTTGGFFTNAEFEKFTLPNEGDYCDIDKLHATISVSDAECGYKKRNAQRNSSAYALFYRDNQPSVRAQTKNATFGEVSKAIAKMWENSSEQLKRDYKKRVQSMKKQELMQKAIFKATSIGPNQHGNTHD